MATKEQLQARIDELEAAAPPDENSDASKAKAAATRRENAVIAKYDDLINLLQEIGQLASRFPEGPERTRIERLTHDTAIGLQNAKTQNIL